MEIILLKKWMGREPGNELNIQEPLALSLIQRGTARRKREDEGGFREKIHDRMIKKVPIQK